MLQLRIWREMVGLAVAVEAPITVRIGLAGRARTHRRHVTARQGSPGQDMTEHHEDHRESVVQEPGHRLSETATREQRPKGLLNPRTVKLFSFVTMSICIVGSVFVSILAIWDFTKSDVWYRSLATLAVIAIGTTIFAVVNEKFGD